MSGAFQPDTDRIGFLPKRILFPTILVGDLPAMRSNCRTCGKPLEPSARGRLPDYCGIPCRRAQEAILRRLRATLRQLEAKAESYSRPGNAYGAHQMQYLLPKLEAARHALAVQLA
jgi:hypothetical protein